MLARAKELYAAILSPKPKVVLNGLVYYERKENAQGGKEWKNILMREGIPEEDILMTREAKHTGEEAERIVECAERYRWKELIIMATPYHLPRCLLTILGVLREKNRKINIYGATVPGSAWDEVVEWVSYASGEKTKGTIQELLEYERRKSEQYRNERKKGNTKITPIMSPEEGLKYLMQRGIKK